MARSIFEARQLITHGHISVQTSAHGPLRRVAPQAGVAGPKALRPGPLDQWGCRAGAGHIVPVGALISSSADVSLSAYLSRASTATRRARDPRSLAQGAVGAPRTGASLLWLRPLRASVAPSAREAGADARPRLMSGILIRPASRRLV